MFRNKYRAKEAKSDRSVWVEYREIKDDVDIAGYLEIKGSRKVWKLTVKTSKTSEARANNCNGGILSQNLNIGSMTKNHRVNTSKKVHKLL